MPTVLASPPRTPADDLTDDLTRRRLLGGVGALALVPWLAGCAGDGPASGSGAASPAGGFPVTLPDAFGDVTIATRPSRIVTIGFLRDTDIAVALGAPVVGLTGSSLLSGRGLAPWTEKLLGAQPVEILPETLDIEAVAALRPDLILATDNFELEQVHAKLSQIAPVLAYETAPNLASWQDMARRIGTAVGLSARAEELVAAAESALRTAREEHPELEGKTFTFGPGVLDGTETTNSNEDAAAKLLSELGMVLSPTVTALPSSGTPGRAAVSPEQLGALDADIVILAYGSDAEQGAFEAQPLFERLEAVQRGSYLPLSFTLAFAFAFPSISSIPFGLEQVVPKLSAAAKAAPG